MEKKVVRVVAAVIKKDNQIFATERGKRKKRERQSIDGAGRGEKERIMAKRRDTDIFQTSGKRSPQS